MITLPNLVFSNLNIFKKLWVLCKLGTLIIHIQHCTLQLNLILLAGIFYWKKQVKTGELARRSKCSLQDHYKTYAS